MLLVQKDKWMETGDVITRTTLELRLEHLALQKLEGEESRVGKA